ncbi:MAG: hypothetical protein K8L91_27975 [Anaerolineae bacterium]|nr:hypothetical protein [Anaerolineae bacterium]
MSDDLNPEIRISVLADTERGQQSVAAIQRLVAGARAEVEKFAQAGGLGRLAKDAGILDVANDLIDETAATLHSATRRAETLQQAIGAVGTESSQFDRLNGRLQATQTEILDAVAYLQQIPLALQDGAAQAELLNRTLAATPSAPTASGGTAPRVTPRRSGGGTADTLGAIERPFAQIAGTASFLGLAQGSAVTQSLRGVSEISGSIEALGRMRETMAVLRETTGSSTLALGGLGVALLALGPAINALKDKAHEVTGPFRDLVEEFDRERELLEYRKQISGQTQDQIASEIRTQEQLVAMYALQIGQAKTAIDASEDLGDRLIGDMGLVSDALTQVFALAGYDADVLQDKLPELQKNLETARQKLEALNDPLIQISLAAQQAQEAYFQQLDLEKQRLQLIESGTPEQLANLRTTAEQERQAIYDTFANFGDAIQDQVITAARAAGLEEELQTLFRNSAAFGGDIPTQTNAYAELAQVLGVELPESVFAALNTFNEQIERMNELDEVLNFLDTGDIQDAIATRDKQQQQLHALNDSTKEVIKSEASHVAAVNALATANEAAIEAETKHAQALLDDAAKTSQSIQQLETARAEQLAQQRQADAEAAVIAGFRSQIEAAKEAEAIQARNDKITALQQEAHTSELTALQKHAAAKAKTQADFDLQQKRREEDLAEDLRQAEEERDVKAYLRLERQGEKELNRAKEDHDLRSKEQETALREQIREIRQNASDRIRVERDSGQRRLTQSQLLERKLADFQNDLARQHQLEQRQIEAQGYQERITQLRLHMRQVTQELLTGLVTPLRGGLGVLVGTNNTLAPLPVGAGSAATSGLRTGGASLAVTVSIGQQNIGRFAQAEDIARVERQNQQLARTVLTAVQRSRANTGGWY